MADTRYVVTGWPLALVSFTVAFFGLLFGIGAVVVVGIPIFISSLYALRSFAERERCRIEAVLGVRIPRPVYKEPPPDAGALRRLLNPMTDPMSWIDLLHGSVMVWPASLTFLVVGLWWLNAIFGSLYWAYGWLGPTSMNQTLLNVGLGLLCLLTLPLVARGCAQSQARLSRLILSGVAELQERIFGLEAERTTLVAQRDSAVSAEAVALRRLERDIHDGPQQRLVRLALDLGRAEKLFEADPQAARRAVAEALTQTEETLGELRALSRGIAPPILTDRGLVAAVGAIAGRCTVPVALDATDLSGRPEPTTEQAAYFVVTEALANVAKHSRATGCSVTLRRSGESLLATVTDDGVGGAHLAKGHGLAGLSDRARAAGGTLTVHSPPGGPTTITAELPWQ